jgi:Flp pilus assembly CpaE family ATPase
MPIAARIANDYSAVSRAINLARPLCEDAPGSRATRDLMALARRLAGVGSEVQEGDRVELNPESEMRRKVSFWPFGKGKAA